MSFYDSDMGKRAWMVVLVWALAFTGLAGSANAAPQFRPNCFFSLCGQLSDDGGRVIFPFQDVIRDVNTDEPQQIYEWSNGTLRPLVEFPPEDPNNRTRVEVQGISRDGGTVFVHSSHALTGGGGPGLFELKGGGVRRLTPFPNPPANFDFQTPYLGNSTSGDRVFLRDFNQGCASLWELSATGTNLLASPGEFTPPLQTTPYCLTPEFGGVSRDNSSVFFSLTSTEDIYLEETKIGENFGCLEIYEIRGGQTTKLTDFPATVASEACHDFRFGDSSTDGRSILFSTKAPLAGADSDQHTDMYVRGPGGEPHLVSPGPRIPPALPDEYETQVPLALSGDGSRAVFLTDRALSPQDGDQSLDVYASTVGGAPELVSTGAADTDVNSRIPSREDVSQWQVDVSDDAKTVAFETDQRLLAEDQDDQVDVYVNSNGSTTLVSLTSFGGNGGNKARLVGLSGDGSSVAYQTRERMTEFDFDGGATDFFLRAPGGDSATARRARAAAARVGTRTILVSEETIAPRIKIRPRLQRRGRSRVKLRISCPSAEVNAPCEGKVGIGGGKKPFRIAAGHSRWLGFAVRRPGRRAFVAKGFARDQVGNSRPIRVKTSRRRG